MKNLDRQSETEQAYTTLDEAVMMTVWFPDYLFGVQEKPGQLPSLTVKRLRRQFGESGDEGLRLMCDEIPMFSSEIQPDVAAYICGFPEEDLELMLQQDLKTIISLIDERFPPVVPRQLTGNKTPVATPTRKVQGEPMPLDTQPNRQSDKGEIRLSLGASSSEILAWQDDAICAQTDPEAFFPEKGGSAIEAKKICFSCASQFECLVYALKNEEHFGIWGGHSERERRNTLKAAKKIGETDVEVIAQHAITSATARRERATKKKKSAGRQATS
jgi:WhiB family redox-sensing transcriptional regulator